MSLIVELLAIQIGHAVPTAVAKSEMSITGDVGVNLGQKLTYMVPVVEDESYADLQEESWLSNRSPRAFGAEKLGRVVDARGRSGHAEVRIGDAVVMLFDGDTSWPATPAFLRLYVEDARAAHRQAVAAGAVSPEELERRFTDPGFTAAMEYMQRLRPRSSLAENAVSRYQSVSTRPASARNPGSPVDVCSLSSIGGIPVLTGSHTARKPP